MSTYKTNRIDSSQFQVCSLGIPCALLTLKKSTLGDVMCVCVWGVGGEGERMGQWIFLVAKFCQILTYTNGVF